jgi:Putative Flp pilus-assembly TadE/G-like
MSRLQQRLAHEERGAMILTVAFFLPVLIAFGVFVLDVGNAFEHRRHLQLQADAAALATGQEFNGCRTDPSGSNDAIKDRVVEYGGRDHNPQIGGADAQARVLTVLNSSSYAGPSGSLGEPCDTGFADVKLTEQDSPPFFEVLGTNDYHGHARLQVLRLQSSNRLLPIAVEDPTPTTARAIFINEATGDTLAEVPLKQNGSEGGLAIWDNSDAPASVPITAEHVGVRIALGGASSTNCADNLVACYDAGAPSRGLLHIQGWSAEGTVAQDPPDGPQDRPLARSVSLEKGTCADPYFSSASATCTVRVRASVDFGGDPLAVGAKLIANVAGTRYAMTYDTATQTWSSGEVPVPPLSGPQDVVIEWEETSGRIGDATCKATGKNDGCKGTFDVQQRIFSATPDRSGKIALAEVSEGGVAWTNSLQRCTTVLPSCHHSLVVKIGVAGTLGLSDPSGPPVHLRVRDGSQNQSLDCDSTPGTSLNDELATGCGQSYTPNTGTPCPGNASALWGTPEPWNCVAVQTGGAVNQIAAGLNTRVLGDEKPKACTAPNMWPDWEDNPADPRIIYVFVTPFGSFAGSGSDTKPVLRLAAFYLTGWNGQGGGFDNPCQGNGDDTPDDPGEIVGHFIKYVETAPEGGATDPCDFNSLDVCAAVLVE